MRKFLMMALVFACSVIGANAQKRNVDFSVKAGIGMSSWLGSDADYTDCRFAYRVGFGVDVPIQGIWGFQTGLNFTGIGANLDTDGIEDIVEFKTSQLYLELPLMATARVEAGKGLGIVFNAGPYMGIGVGGKSKMKSNLDLPHLDGEVSSDTFGDGGLKRFDFGLGFGVNFEINRFLVGLDTRFGLTRLASDVNTHNFALLFGVGYKF